MVLSDAKSRFELRRDAGTRHGRGALKKGAETPQINSLRARQVKKQSFRALTPKRHILETDAPSRRKQAENRDWSPFNHPDQGLLDLIRFEQRMNGFA
jgi:hypothetical protein